MANFKTFYKYVSNPEYFLDGFYIRASQLSALNDPFEANYSDEGLTEYADLLEYNYEGFIEDIEKRKHEVGVICFTESKDNLLMWSHYADEHKGCVLGFVFDNKNSQLLEHFNYDPQNNYDGFFTPISYRKRPRYELDAFDSNLADSWSFEDTLLHEIFERKSDEWLYEKEHRTVLKLNQADKVIVPIDHISQRKERELIAIGAYKHCSINLQKKVIEFLLEDMDENIRKEVADYLTYFSKNPEALYMFKVNKISLCSITLGAKCDEKKLRAHFYNHQSYKEHVRFYRTKLQSHSYSLFFEEIEF